MLLHVARHEGEDTPEICLTVAPIAYGEFKTPKGQTFISEAPTELNPGSPLPPFQEKSEE